MERAILQEKLNYKRATREARGGVAYWVLERPHLFSILLDFCYDRSNEKCYRATWILEFVLKEDLSLIYPELDFFCDQLEHVKRDQAKRPMAKICELLILKYYQKPDAAIQQALSKKHREIITANCFDWLITEQKVACKAYSIAALFELGTEFHWIHPELEVLLKEGYSKHTAAYKARAREYLIKIAKFREQKQGS